MNLVDSSARARLSLYSVQIENDQAFDEMNLGKENLVGKEVHDLLVVFMLPPQRMEASLLSDNADCGS